MKNETTEKIILQFLRDDYPTTYIDPGFQRNETWSQKNKYEFMWSVYNGFVDNPIVVVDIKSSLDRAERE